MCRWHRLRRLRPAVYVPALTSAVAAAATCCAPTRTITFAATALAATTLSTTVTAANAATTALASTTFATTALAAGPAAPQRPCDDGRLPRSLL